jgi:phosphatidylinositol alpha-1,6-mannosyltransferase
MVDRPGGIARVCRLMSRALVESGVGLAVVALHDRKPARGGADDEPRPERYVPCSGSRAAFVWQAFVTALRYSPSVVFTAHPNFSLLTWLVARLTGARAVVLVHGVDAWEPLKPLRRWGFRNADMVISVSKFTAERAVQSNGLSAERVQVLHNCLDPGLALPAPGAGGGGGLTLLTVARITLAEQYKGHDYVIRALPELLRRFPSLVYSVVGDGDGRGKLEKLAEEVGVAHAVRFHGNVPEAELPRHYADATLFIMPSRGEGFGLAFIEAMAHGKPVIGGNADASPEVIADGVTGYVVDPTSVGEIVDRVSRLLADESLRRRLGRTAARDVRERFGYELFKERLLRHLFRPSTDSVLATEERRA